MDTFQIAASFPPAWVCLRATVACVYPNLDTSSTLFFIAASHVYGGKLLP